MSRFSISLKNTLALAIPQFKRKTCLSSESADKSTGQASNNTAPTVATLPTPPATPSEPEHPPTQLRRRDRIRKAAKGFFKALGFASLIIPGIACGVGCAAIGTVFLVAEFIVKLVKMYAMSLYEWPMLLYVLFYA
ncbi:hypothetical protein BJY04DRAFT_224371 [Aspergillus karnatakaensis]|uniref:uncharacterized protein n=1 Tax=Aspergillus karnatakaensis TaxID=1810916 RepID=UPI003CCCE187